MIEVYSFTINIKCSGGLTKVNPEDLGSALHSAWVHHIRDEILLRNAAGIIINWDDYSWEYVYG